MLPRNRPMKKGRRQFLKNTSIAAIAAVVTPKSVMGDTLKPTEKEGSTCNPTTLDFYGQGPFYTPNAPTLVNDFRVGLNFGIGLNLNRLGVDLRYERGFSDNEATLISNNIISPNGRLDTRPEQLILSLSYRL